MFSADSTQKSQKFESNKRAGYVNFETSEDNLHYEGVSDIDPRELVKKMDQVVMIDVRQPDEYHGELGHIPNARLIVLDTLEDRINEVPKDKTVVFVCRSGSRSARATSIAKSLGYKEVFNLKGGMPLWNDLHFATEA